MSDVQQSPIPQGHSGSRGSGWVGVLLFCLLCVPNPVSAGTIASLSGKILGLVTDAGGIPQMGAVVTLLTHQDKFYEQALTNEKGAFSFDGLAAGAYSIRISLASYTTVLKSNIFVQPGLRTLLNVSMAGLFSSVQL